jgi:tRNA dimethylallyltransferase
MLSNDNRIVAVVGPTCTGKSNLALDLARRFDGEIVNADSMQVYKHFDIGTAKPEPWELAEVRHHLIDVVEPGEEFNAAAFKELADRAIAQIWSSGRLPVVVGGTGLYMRALLYDLFKVPRDDALREELKQAYEADELKVYEELKAVDPAYALRISHRDRIRVVRALEVYRLTGVQMSEWERIHGFRDLRYRALVMGLRKDRAELYRRIDNRVDEMLAKGWVEEVRGLLAMGYQEDLKPFQGIGYREILLYIKGLICYEDMVKDIKMQTRHYAKRQLTWFAKEKGAVWFEYPEARQTVIEKVAGFLQGWI